MNNGDPAWFAQNGCACRLEWGRDGARRASERGDILVVVDALRFSSVVATAAARGALIELAPWPVPDGQARPSLSPLDYLDVEAGARITLSSPNGATCARFGATVPALFVGGPINASATAEAVERAVATFGRSVTVLACGERWGELGGEDGDLRFAVEDFLGAGSVLAGLVGPKSPEAQAAEDAFVAACARDFETELMRCGSGIELIAKGRAADVAHCARVDLYDVAVALRDGCLSALTI